MDNQKKRLAIVTSFDDLCGNAEYSDVLKNGLGQFFEVSIIPLNMDIMRTMTRRSVDRYIRSVAKQLRDYDYVNIQFESGLFGIFPNDILKRLRYLLNSSKKIILTMHRVDIKKPILSVGCLQSILALKPKKLVTEIMNNWRNNRFAKLYSRIVKSCVRRKSSIVVHSKREKHRILSISNNAKVADHPLAYLSLKEALYYRSLENKPAFLSKYNLPSDAITIGIFGFIAPYKGIPVLMKCLPFLPDNYHILTFGSQHPLKVSYEPKGDLNVFKYINMLIPDTLGHAKNKNDIEKSAFNHTISSAGNAIADRFHFLGGFYRHEDFIRAIVDCDVIVFPYNEVGQSASGVLGLALDLGSNIICAQTLAFLELMKYAGAAVRTFSIGNHLELAEKIKIAVKNGAASQEAIQEYNQKYNLTSNAEFYSNLIQAL